jgi:hypothetical protein
MRTDWTATKQGRSDIQTPLIARARCLMKTHVLKGSKQEIAEILIRISGEVREAIVFVEEPATAAPVEFLP